MVDDEMPAQATAHCIPICMQMVSCESRAYITRSEPGQRLRNNCNLPTRDTTLRAAMSHQDASRIHTHKSHREYKKIIISCIYELT